MPKSFVPTLVLVLMVLGSTPVLAQSEGAGPQWMFCANAGYSLPVASFRDAYDGCLAVGASGCYMFSSRHGLELAAEWTKFPASDEYAIALRDSPGEYTDAEFVYLPIMVNFVESFPTKHSFVLYVKGGVGVYLETAERERAGEKERRNQNDFGLNLGGGIRVPVAKVMVIDLGGRFHNVMTEDEGTQYLTMSAGVGFVF